MDNAKYLLFVALGIFAAVYLAVFVSSVMAFRRGIRQAAAAAPGHGAAQGTGGDAAGVAPSLTQLAIGAVTNFFDTLGIGSFATTTAAFKLAKMVPVKLIPGTLNVGHTIPTVAQAYIYTRIVPVDSTTLVLMIAAAVAGSWLGAGVVVRWPRRTVQIAMGYALLGAAAILLLQLLNLIPGGGYALTLTGSRLAIGLAGNFVLGMLMMIGIGLYAPCMILIQFLGMAPTAAFPIMMGSCAFLMPASSIRFARSRSFDIRAALGLAIGGLPAVLLAAFVVKSLPLTYVRWLVLGVVTYTSLNMLTTVAHEEAPLGAAEAALQPEG